MCIRTIAAIIVSLAAITTTASAPFLIKRVVGGTPVEDYELPVFAELINVDGEAFGCGGLLIGPQTIVTAGHCVDGRGIGSVYLGGVTSRKGKHLEVVKTVLHPEYSDFLLNDIRLVFISEKVEGPYASFGGEPYPEDASKATVAGYGMTSYNGPYSPILLKVQVTIGSEVECAEHMNQDGHFFDHKTQICATDNGHSACRGDSGGPLYIGSGKDVHIVGVVSGSGNEDRCGEKGTFQYYTFIEAFVPWIKSEIEKFEKSGTTLTTEALANL
ncbi:hypothetical protein BGZ67_002889 [Mortierella alpina]|nr:hypothetical protein BGZ67_002889 [Mortierella alpina]